MTLATAASVVLAVQVLSYVVLGIIFIKMGQFRLGIVQLLLAAVQGVLYTGRMR